MLSAFGVGTPTEALIVMRDGGITLTGVGIINWLARHATGAPLRAVLWGNIFIYVVDGLVNAWEIVAGLIPPGVAPASLIIALAVVIMYASALRAHQARPIATA